MAERGQAAEASPRRSTRPSAERDDARYGRAGSNVSLIEHLGSDAGNAVVQLADEAAYGRTRLGWHRKLFVNGMKKSAFQNLPPEIVREIEADSWASMIMCVARLTDGDDRRSVTIRMLPRLLREDDETATTSHALRDERSSPYAHRRRRGRFRVSLDGIEAALDAIQDVITETTESLGGQQLSTDEEPE